MVSTRTRMCIVATILGLTGLSSCAEREETSRPTVTDANCELQLSSTRALSLESPRRVLLPERLVLAGAKTPNPTDEAVVVLTSSEQADDPVICSYGVADDAFALDDCVGFDLAAVRAAQAPLELEVVAAELLVATHDEAALVSTCLDPSDSRGSVMWASPRPKDIRVLSREEIYALRRRGDDAAEEPPTIPTFGALSDAMATPEHFEAFLARSESPSSSATFKVQTMSTITNEPEVVALARALDSDVDRIFEYIHDSIETTPIYGLKKSPARTILDGSGTSFDQASLLVALLRRAGYEAQFVLGLAEIDGEQFKHWFGIDDPNALVVAISRMGFPVYAGVLLDDELFSLTIPHIWVVARGKELGSGWYSFDPAVKKLRYHAPHGDLRAELGGSASAVLAAAGGSTGLAGAEYRGLNRDALEHLLHTYATTLTTQYMAARRHLRPIELLGGYEIESIVGDADRRDPGLPYEASSPSLTPRLWNAIPDAHRTKITLEIAGISKVYFADEVSDREPLVFRYGADNKVRLHRDSVSAVATATQPGASGGSQALNVTIDEPHAHGAGGFSRYQGSMQFDVVPNYTYAMLLGFGDTGRGTVEHFRALAQRHAMAGIADDSVRVLGARLTQLGVLWMAQETRLHWLASRLNPGSVRTWHSVGVAGQKASPYVDIPMSTTSTFSVADGYHDPLQFVSRAGFGSALESTVIEQSQKVQGASTVSLFGVHSASGKPFYEATGATWASVEPRLTGYSTAQRDEIEANLNAGYRYILPSHGSIVLGEWTGQTYLAFTNNSTNSISFAIGGAKGGYGTVPIPPKKTATALQATAQPRSLYSGSLHSSVVVGDPVDVTSGHFVMDIEDIGVGPDELNFSFHRQYSSGNELNDGDLGRGWSHNFHMRANYGSDGFQGLGEDSPVDATAMITGLILAYDLVATSTDLRHTIVTAAVQNWATHSLADNAVTLRVWGDSKQFIKVPNGGTVGALRSRYEKPPGSADVLVDLSGGVRLVDRHKNQAWFDDQGRVRWSKDPRGNQLTFTYAVDEPEKLTRVAHSWGWRFDFGYTGDKLTQVADHSGRKVSFAFSGELLTSATSAMSQDTRYSYVPGTGRIREIFYPVNPTVPFVTNVYDEVGRVQYQDNAFGARTIYRIAGTYSSEIRPGGLRRTWYFDRFGNVVRGINGRGRAITTHYNGMQLPVSVTHPEGDSVTTSYDGNGNPRVVRRWDPGKTHKLETWIEYDYAWNKPKRQIDERGHDTLLTYNNFGELIERQGPLVAGLGRSTERWTYTGRGQVATYTASSGTQSLYAYDGMGRLVKETADASKTGEFTSYTHDGHGNVRTVTDPTGARTDFFYRPDRKLARRLDPAPAAGAARPETQWIYNQVGEQITEDRRLGGQWLRVQHGYDRAGRLVWSTEPFVAGTLGPATPRTFYGYDGANRRIQEKDPMGRITRLVYWNDDTLRSVYDAWGTPGQVRRVYNEYTPNGRLAWTQNAIHGRTTYHYDSLKRLWIKRFPHPSTGGASNPSDFEQYNHDPAGNITSLRTRAGDVFSFSYDARNLLVSRTGAGLPQLSRKYDLSGRLIEATEGNRRTVLHYDALGRDIQNDEIVVSTGWKRWSQRRYDAAGNLSQLILPGFGITYERDGTHRITRVVGGGAEVARFGYDQLSRRTRMVRPGMLTDYRYDAEGRLEAISHQGAGPNDVEFSYGYNAAGQVTRVGISNPSFVYDPGVPRVENAAVNKLDQQTSYAGSPVAHDANGNTVSSSQGTAIHDALNRLTGISGVSSYVYDGLGRRVWTWNAGQGGLETLFDGKQKVIEQRGDFYRRYIPGPGGEILAIREHDSAGNVAVRYPLTDAQGSMVAYVENGGSHLRGYRRYGPFGSGSGYDCRVTSKDCVTLGYAGHFREDGLVDMRARFYDPARGRFLETDPAGTIDGPNLYAYVGNDPVNYVDPMGTERASNPFSSHNDPWAATRNPDGSPKVVNASLPFLPALLAGGRTVVQAAPRLINYGRRLLGLGRKAKPPEKTPEAVSREKLERIAQELDEFMQPSPRVVRSDRDAFVALSGKRDRRFQLHLGDDATRGAEPHAHLERLSNRPRSRRFKDLGPHRIYFKK